MIVHWQKPNRRTGRDPVNPEPEPGNPSLTVQLVFPSELQPEPQELTLRNLIQFAKFMKKSKIL